MKRYLKYREDGWQHRWLAHVELSQSAHRVLYDQFVQDQDPVCEMLDLPKGPVEALDEVVRHGGGSSFDGQDKRGTDMSVLERWKTIPREMHDQYITEEMAQLNEELFGWRLR